MVVPHDRRQWQRLGHWLRRPNGFKFSVAGSKEGLFIPVTTGGESSRVFVCEGPTDTAALLDMGSTNVVGRPSCTGGIKLLVDLVRRRQPAEVVIVADADEPGRHGADNLASVMVAYVPTVRVIAPPVGIKDARAWFQRGGTHQEVQHAIDAVPAHRLRVHAVAVGKDR
jgi:DNA primase